MNNYWAFLPMTDSTDLLGCAPALQARLAEDGYLLLRGVVDPRRVQEVRIDLLRVLAGHGWVRDGWTLLHAEPVRAPVREGDDEYFAAYDDIQKLESFHALAHDQDLLTVMRSVVGGSAFPHPLKVARLVFPGNPDVTTPPHQDYPNNQGTPELTAAWIPLGDCPRTLGSLAILAGSHRFGVLDLDFSLGPGNRQAVLTADHAPLRWVTSDLSLGDIVVFGALTVHASLHNDSVSHVRLSADYRYQPERAELADHVLRPHFDRLEWGEIYAGWERDDLKYYWRDLDYRVVAFDPERLKIAESNAQLTAVLAYQHRQARRGAGIRTTPPTNQHAT